MFRRKITGIVISSTLGLGSLICGQDAPANPDQPLEQALENASIPANDEDNSPAQPTPEAKPNISGQVLDARTGEPLGTALVLNQDQLFVGAFEKLNDAKGAVHRYQLDPSTGQWQHQQRIAHPDFAKGDFFGSILHFSGDTLYIGVPSDKSQAWANGKVYCYSPSGDRSYQCSQIIQPESQINALRFGSRIQTLGDFLVIAAIGDGDGNNDKNRFGSVHFYHKQNNTWSPAYTLPNPAKSGAGRFGYRLEPLGEKLLISAPFKNTEHAVEHGEVFLHCTNTKSTTKLTLPEPQLNTNNEAGTPANIRLGFSLTAHQDQLYYNHWSNQQRLIITPIAPLLP